MNCTDYNTKEYCYISLCVNRKLPNNSGVSDCRKSPAKAGLFVIYVI